MTPVRCAIYTRKSSDEGLEQGFNSLDAQREACAAYILSQASEGWEALSSHYDDGGISGGTLERPALKQLLADVAAGKVDIIVVYKVDRLTRSLLDFAKLVEALDKAGTSFVSITQSFNTTTSMGRLTLNMLLSFAQFEREVTAERIRDKITASKAKGMWMGGIPPLGYAPDGRSLSVVKEHAALIRQIYDWYQKLGNVRLVADRLIDEGICVPRRSTGSGRSFGGGQFARGQLYAILRNPIYAGNIGHRGKVYPGNHPAIIESEQWDAVQAQIAGHVKGSGGKRRSVSGSGQSVTLAGLLVDEAGETLIATHTTKGKQQYRYYVSRSLHLGQAAGSKGTEGSASPADQRSSGQHASDTCPSGPQASALRLPAREIEQLVAQELAALFADPLGFAERTRISMDTSSFSRLVSRCKVLAADLNAGKLGKALPFITVIRIASSHLEIVLSAAALAHHCAAVLEADAPQHLHLTSHVRLTRTGRAVRLVHTDGNHAANPGAHGQDSSDARILRHIVTARAWWAILAKGEIDMTTLAREAGVTVSYVTRILRLAFLAPRIIEGIMAGRLKAGIGSMALCKVDAIDADWDIQEQALLAARIKGPA